MILLVIGLLLPLSGVLFLSLPGLPAGTGGLIRSLLSLDLISWVLRDPSKSNVLSCLLLAMDSVAFRKGGVVGLTTGEEERERGVIGRGVGTEVSVGE